MEFLKRRQKNRRRLYSKVTIIGLIIVLAILIRPTWKIFEKSRESRKNLNQAQVELTTLENRKQELEKDVTYIKTEEGRDQEIRSKFGVAKNGETMVVIIRDEKIIKPTETPVPPGFFERFWSRFQGFFGLE